MNNRKIKSSTLWWQFSLPYTKNWIKNKITYKQKIATGFTVRLTSPIFQHNRPALVKARDIRTGHIATLKIDAPLSMARTVELLHECSPLSVAFSVAQCGYEKKCSCHEKKERTKKKISITVTQAFTVSWGLIPKAVDELPNEPNIYL